MVDPDPSSDAEQRLIHRLIAKDESGLEELLTAYGPKVRGFLRTISSNELSPSEIDFVFNQAAINLWRFSHRIDPKRKTIRGWFLKIARNALMSYLRGEKRHAAVELQYEPEFNLAEDCEEDVPDNEIPFSEAARDKELHAAVKAQMARFELEHAEVHMLYAASFVLTVTATVAAVRQVYYWPWLILYLAVSLALIVVGLLRDTWLCRRESAYMVRHISESARQEILKESGVSFLPPTP